MSKKMKLFVLICLCICISATSNVACGAQGVSISGLPAAVQAVVNREFAGVRITEVDNDDDYDRDWGRGDHSKGRAERHSSQLPILPSLSVMQATFFASGAE